MVLDDPPRGTSAANGGRQLELVRENLVPSSQFESLFRLALAFRAGLIGAEAPWEKEVLGVSALTLNCASDWERPIIVATRKKMRR